jgi:hypothetical protein
MMFSDQFNTEREAFIEAVNLKNSIPEKDRKKWKTAVWETGDPDLHQWTYFVRSGPILFWKYLDWYVVGFVGAMDETFSYKRNSNTVPRIINQAVRKMQRLLKTKIRKLQKLEATLAKMTQSPKGK